MKRVFVSLGGNIGDVKSTLSTALHQMAQLSHVCHLRASCLYYTSPVGQRNQPYYYNAVCQFAYTSHVRLLLEELQQIEKTLGRVRVLPHGPRTCDLDILLFGDDLVKEKDLEIPHPRMWERLFVLLPLQEFLPEDERIRTAITNLRKTDSGTVELAGDTSWCSLCSL